MVTAAQQRYALRFQIFGARMSWAATLGQGAVAAPAHRLHQLWVVKKAIWLPHQGSATVAAPQCPLGLYDKQYLPQQNRARHVHAGNGLPSLSIPAAEPSTPGTGRDKGPLIVG